MIKSKKVALKHQLICSLCAYTIDNQKIIDSYRNNRTFLIKHCINCLSLHHSKNRSIKKYLKILMKRPDMIRFMCRNVYKQEKCRECDCEYFVAWNGFCPKCGENLCLNMYSI